MLIIVRRLEWDMGHRVVGHEGKCRFPHGHRYAAEVHMQGPLDKLGRVVDFGDAKAILGEWLDNNLDHAFLAWEQDKQLVEAFQMIQERKLVLVSFNPTAENIAAFLTAKFRELVPEVRAVTLWETPNCRATYDISMQNLSDQ